MKNSSVDKGKDESKQKPKAIKLSGDIIFRAKKGCVLPIRYGGGLARITSEKDCHLNMESLAYESKIMIRRSLKQGHIMIKDKGAK